MKRRSQVAAVLLVAILVLLAYVLYRNNRPTVVAVAPGVSRGFVPLSVENPALRVDLLEKMKSFQYEGPRRNIFSATPMPAPAPVQPSAVVPVMTGPTPLPGPAPVVVPATFFGRVTDRKTGASRAFFSTGDDVFVLGLGEILMNRFRLVQIGENTVEMEELSSGRRTTLTMERPPS
jgi:hypothetical protein